MVTALSWLERVFDKIGLDIEEDISIWDIWPMISDEWLEKMARAGRQMELQSAILQSYELVGRYLKIFRPPAILVLQCTTSWHGESNYSSLQMCDILWRRFSVPQWRKHCKESAMLSGIAIIKHALYRAFIQVQSSTNRIKLSQNSLPRLWRVYCLPFTNHMYRQCLNEAINTRLNVSAVAHSMY